MIKELFKDFKYLVLKMLILSVTIEVVQVYLFKIKKISFDKRWLFIWIGYTFGYMIFELFLKKVINSGKRDPKLNELFSNVIKLTFLFVSSKVITNLLSGQHPINYNKRWFLGILFAMIGIAFYEFYLKTNFRFIKNLAFHESVEIAVAFSIGNFISNCFEESCYLRSDILENIVAWTIGFYLNNLVVDKIKNLKIIKKIMN